MALETSGNTRYPSTRACHWITNIEEAVNYGAVLEVYYFVDHVGMGKVEGFSTAGHEHLRREELNSRRAEFRETDDFKAVLTAGLEGLSKRQRGDSSSPYSREENRLFLAISCMVAGRRSQAEVAWLERKGYRYVERDVSPWLSTCLEEVHLEAVVPTQVHMGPRPAPEASSPGAEGRDCRDVDLPGADAVADQMHVELGFRQGLFLFDLTDRSSFDQLRRYLASDNRLEQQTRVLVGNKADLLDRRAVTWEEAQGFSAQVGAAYFETSATEGTGIEDFATAVNASASKGYGAPGGGLPTNGPAAPAAPAPALLVPTPPLEPPRLLHCRGGEPHLLRPKEVELLNSQGFLFMDRFLQERCYGPFFSQCQIEPAEALGAVRRGLARARLRPARLGRGESVWSSTAVRGDEMTWLSSPKAADVSGLWRHGQRALQRHAGWSQEPDRKDAGDVAEAAAGASSATEYDSITANLQSMFAKKDIPTDERGDFHASGEDAVLAADEQDPECYEDRSLGFSFF
eukprot:s512_g5.t1